LVIIALFFRFQQDDHPTLLNVMAHVETGTYPFQVTLQNTRAMLPKVIQSRFTFRKSNVQSYLQMQSSLMGQL